MQWAVQSPLFSQAKVTLPQTNCVINEDFCNAEQAEKKTITKLDKSISTQTLGVKFS